LAAQLGNCRKCGKLFLHIRDICDDCYQKQEEDYIKSAEYLREHPGSTIQELSDATNVSVGQIREFILAQRIVAGYFPNLSYPCESCGTMIRSGRKCSNCMDTLNQLAKQMEKKEPKRGAEKNGKTSGYITRNL
jgi:flagellar operon protein (TIGR03826 family)